MPIKPGLLEILACPSCHSKVVETTDAIVCTGEECRRKYPIHENIPVMLIEESEVLDQEPWKDLLAST